MSLVNRQFQISQLFEAFDRENNIARTFSPGEKLYGSYSPDKSSVLYQGFKIPAEYVTDLGLKNSILILSGVGIAFVVIAILVFSYFKNKK